MISISGERQHIATALPRALWRSIAASLACAWHSGEDAIGVGWALMWKDKQSEANPTALFCHKQT